MQKTLIFLPDYWKCIHHKSQKPSRRGWLFTVKQTKLLVGFVPDSFADESSQAAAIGGLAFESVAGTAGGFEGHAFQNFGFNGRFGFDVIKFVFHLLVLLTFIKL